MEFQNHIGKKFKVTRRLPEMSVTETRFFTTKEDGGYSMSGSSNPSNSDILDVSVSISSGWL